MDNKLLVPGAIVVAGIVIAGAVFVSGKSGAPGAPADGTTDAPTVEPVVAGEHIFGNPDAAIKIVEFSDIDCPYCRQFHETMHQVLADYGADGQVAWVYRNFPLDSLHPDARRKAESAECVASLGGNNAYWQYLDTLFDREDEGRGDLRGIAEALGIDGGAFDACVADGTFKDLVQSQVNQAVAAGGRGTPHSLVVNADGDILGTINGAQPYEVIKQIVEAALATGL